MAPAVAIHVAVLRAIPFLRLVPVPCTCSTHVHLQHRIYVYMINRADGTKRKALIIRQDWQLYEVRRFQGSMTHEPKVPGYDPYYQHRH